MFADMNWLAILLSAVASMVVGFVWYSPILVGNAWMKEMGWTKASMDKDKMKGMQKTYAVSFVGALIMAFVLSNVFAMTGTVELMVTLKMAFWLWLGFIAPVQLTDVLFGGRSLKLWALNTGYQLLSLLAMGAVLVSVG